MNFLENWLKESGSLQESVVAGSKEEDSYEGYSKYFNQDDSLEEKTIGSTENPLVVMLPNKMDTKLLENLQKMISTIAISKIKEDGSFVIKYVSEEDTINKTIKGK